MFEWLKKSLDKAADDRNQDREAEPPPFRPASLPPRRSDPPAATHAPTTSAIHFADAGGGDPKSDPSHIITRLCRHIIGQRHKMIIDIDPGTAVWSDGAILEIATDFPSELQQLISRPTHYQDIRSFLKGLDADAPEWRRASAARSERGDRYAVIRSLDQMISTTVESLYVEYLAQRYPTADIRIKGQFEPVIFVVDGEIRACLMPVKF